MRIGKFVDSFPDKLYRLLMEAAKDGTSDVISFLSHGRAFALHNQQKFIKEIAPKYFRLLKLPSFQRQLNLYVVLLWSRFDCSSPEVKIYC